jgi:phosphoglycolate phosphatase-like HAD superfamily hydrolase
VKLVLFDIDGTLVDCGGQTRAPFAAALEAVYGTSGDLPGYEFSGKTDPRIVLDLMTGAGLAREQVLARLARMRDAYVAALAAALEPARVRLLPAVVERLDELAARADVVLGLLTGNWERGAQVKLDSHGLAGYFRFGAYGDDSIERDELPPVAWRRAAEAVGRRFTAAETLIVGDSPLDVACARAHGIRCLAVATGWTPAERLRAAGADRVVTDLAGGDLFELLAA